MKHTVLLIDDDRLPMQYYVRALEQSGLAVVQYFDADSAFRYIQEGGKQIDTVVVDMMLPLAEHTRIGIQMRD